jgi:hypothetical protein
MRRDAIQATKMERVEADTFFKRFDELKQRHFSE